jgi:hypothetical protein
MENQGLSLDRHARPFRSAQLCYNPAVKPETSIKLAIVAVIVLFFAGFVLRAALRLATTAMHSLFGLLVVLILVVLLFVKTK